jgi:carbon storage regulator
VIRRHAGEAILIGQDVEIRVLDVTATTVKLGILAPESIQILRKELKLTAEQNQIAARGVTEHGILSVLKGLPRSSDLP